MNEVVVGVFIFLIVAMVAFDKVKDLKRRKAYEAAQAKIKDQIAVLEAKLAALKK